MDKFKKLLEESIRENETEIIAPSRDYTDEEIIWMKGYNQALHDMLDDFTDDYNKFLNNLIQFNLN